MTTRMVRERLAQDIGGWLSDGLISSATHDQLRERYQARSFGLGQAIKYVGISGGLLCAFGLLGLVGAVAQSQGFAGFLLLAAGCGFGFWGIQMSEDLQDRYAASSRVVLALAVLMGSLGVGLMMNAAGANEVMSAVLTGAVVLPVLVALSYVFKNVFILSMALLGFFHWVGSFAAMLGRSTYAIEVQDPRLMMVASLLVIGIGIAHERTHQPRTARFHHAYETWGLIYLNLSLLILSIDDGAYNAELMWAGLFALFGIAQVVIGARLHSSLFTGFGVTALAINLYTRYFEYFWERTHAGVFFLIGGVSLFALGAGCEVVLRKTRVGGAR